MNLDVCLVSYNNYNTGFSHGTGESLLPQEVVRSPPLALSLGLWGRSLIRLCVCFGVLSCWWPSPSGNRLIIGRQFEGCVSWCFSFDICGFLPLNWYRQYFWSCVFWFCLWVLLQLCCFGSSAWGAHLLWVVRKRRGVAIAHTLCPSAPLCWPLPLLVFMVGYGSLKLPLDSLPLKVVCITWVCRLLEGRNPALAASLSSVSEIALNTFPSLSKASEPWCPERPVLAAWTQRY